MKHLFYTLGLLAGTFELAVAYDVFQHPYHAVVAAPAATIALPAPGRNVSYHSKNIPPVSDLLYSALKKNPKMSGFKESSLTWQTVFPIDDKP